MLYISSILIPYLISTFYLISISIIYLTLPFTSSFTFIYYPHYLCILYITFILNLTTTCHILLFIHLSISFTYHFNSYLLCILFSLFISDYLYFYFISNCYLLLSLIPIYSFTQPSLFLWFLFGPHPRKSLYLVYHIPISFSDLIITYPYYLYF